MPEESPKKIRKMKEIFEKAAPQQRKEIVESFMKKVEMTRMSKEEINERYKRMSPEERDEYQNIAKEAGIKAPTPTDIVALYSQFEMVKSEMVKREIEGLDEGIEYALSIIRQMCAEKKEGPLLVMIGGPSATGKSTFGQWLQQALERSGITTTYIECDGFYKTNVGELATTRYGTKDSPNFDHPGTFDFKALSDFLEKIKGKRAGEIEVPNPPWLREKLGESHKIDLQKVVIVDGLFVHDKSVRGYADLKIGVDSSPQLQFLNRLVRDPERGYAPESIITMFPTVHEMYKSFIKPTLDSVDFVVRNPYHSIEKGKAGKMTFQKKVIGRFPELEDKLKDLPKSALNTLKQHDIYYGVPGGKPEETILVREEESESGLERIIKFKWGAKTAARQEYAVKLPPINVYGALDNAGFKRLESLPEGVKKDRMEYNVEGGIIRIDHVEGSDVKIDAIEFSAETPESLDNLARRFEISPDKLTDKSYKSLILEKGPIGIETGSIGVETEAKFELRDPNACSRLRGMKEIAGLAVLESGIEKHIDVYLDTSDRLIQKSDSTYRIRNGHEVTFKTKIEVKGGLFKREEVVAEILPDQIDELKEYKLKISPVELAKGVAGGAPIHELLKVETNRTTLILNGLEIAIDEVTYNINDKTAKSYELEIEDKGAGESSVRDVANAIKQMFGDVLIASTESKYARGLKMLAVSESVIKGQTDFSTEEEKEAYDNFFVKGNDLKLGEDWMLTRTSIDNIDAYSKCENLVKFAIKNKFSGKFLESSVQALIESMKKAKSPEFKYHEDWYQNWSHSVCHLFESSNLEETLFSTDRLDLVEKLMNTSVKGAIEWEKEKDNLGSFDRIIGGVERFNLNNIDLSDLDKPLHFVPAALSDEEFVSLLKKMISTGEEWSKKKYMRDFAVCTAKTQKEFLVTVFDAVDDVKYLLSAPKAVEILNALAKKIGDEKANAYFHKFFKTDQVELSSATANVKIAGGSKLEEVAGVYVDIEGTLIVDGKLNEGIIKGLEKLKSAGKTIRAFTGASAERMEETLKKLKKFDELKDIITFPVLQKNDFKGKLLEILIDDTIPEIQRFKSKKYVSVAGRIFEFGTSMGTFDKYMGEKLLKD